MISIFSANMPNGLVPEDTVHKCTTPLLFGTRGNLILDIDISSYSNTLFSIIFIYFILQVKPRQDTSRGSLP